MRFLAGAFSRVRSSASSPLCGESDAVHRADVDAGVALDAELAGEHGLHVAVEAALRLLERELVVAELDLGLDVAQRDHLVAQRHPVALSSAMSLS